MQDNFTIILSRTDSIGDVVLTLPMAGLIKKKFPNCKIIFLGRTYTKDVVALSEHVDSFLNYDEIKQLSEAESIRIFKELNASIIIHVFPNYVVSMLAKKARIATRVGTTNRWYHWITCNKLVRLSRKNSDLHEAQLNIKLLSFLGIKNINFKDISSYYGFSNIPFLENTFSQLIDKSKKNIILHPKSKGSAKEWGLPNFKELISILPENKFKIFICGTTEDGVQMKSLLNENNNAVDLTGKFSLKQYIAFIAQCDVMVAASTGPLHIAAALNKTAIGLYASKRPIHPGRWAPIGENARAIVYDVKCKNCSADKNCNCIEKINPEQIANLIQS